MGSNLLFFGNLSGSEKHTLIIYYRSPYSSKCPLFQDDNWTLIRNYPHPYKWVVGCAAQTVDCNSSSDGICRDPRMDLYRLSCEFRAAIKMFFVYGCTIFIDVLSWLFHFQTESEPWCNSKGARQLLKGFWVRSHTTCKNPLQIGAGPNRRGGQEDHASKLDKQCCGNSGKDFVRFSLKDVKTRLWLFDIVWRYVVPRNH